MKRLRLLKVTIHPVFALDDGESLTEYPASEPLTVQAAAWPGIVDDLERQRVAAERNLNEEGR